MYRFFYICLIIFGCSEAYSPSVTLSMPKMEMEKQNIEKWSDLSIRDKIAQMIMVRIRDDYYNSEHWYRNSLKKWLEEDGRDLSRSHASYILFNVD